MSDRPLTLPGLVQDAAERTTAATDALLSLAVGGGVFYLYRTAPPTFALRVWLAALGAFGLAAALGGVAHGFVLSPRIVDTLWHPLYLCLGTAVALFVVGAVVEWRGEPAARRSLPGLLAAAAAFYLATVVSGGDFRVFVAFEALALLLALGVYGAAAIRGRAGAGRIAAALAVSLAAGIVQAAGPARVRLVWVFDHNGLYHLVQLLGLVLLVWGLAASLGRESLAGTGARRKLPADATARGGHVPD